MNNNPFSMNSDAADLIAAASESMEIQKKYSSDPVPDFLERLPEFITDPQQPKKEITLSQSKMKGLLKVIDDTMCGRRFYETRITDKYDDEAGDAALMGCRFEFLAIGTPGRRGEGVTPLLTKTGKISVNEMRTQKNARKCTSVVAELTKDCVSAEVQKKIRVKSLVGTLDVVGYGDKNLIIDIKYSGLLDNKYEEWGWPIDIRNKESHIIQAKQYALLMELLTEERPDFYFLVFSNKKHEKRGEEVFGKYRPYLLKISDEGMNEHKNMILELMVQMQNMLTNKEFTARPSYSKCDNCPVGSCEFRANEPEIVVTNL